MADRSNAQQSVNQYGGNNIVTTVQGGVQQQMIVTNTAGGSTIPSFGSSFSGTGTDGTYYIQGGQQVIQRHCYVNTCMVYVIIIQYDY